MKAAPNHYRALSHGEVAGVLARVRASGERRDVRFAFELMVLTAVRSGAARLARWEEVDLEGRTWTIPAQRMKYTERGDHRAPLSARALGVMREAGAGGQGLVFRAPRGGALPEDAFRELLRVLGGRPTRTGSGRRSATGAPRAGARGSWPRRLWRTRSATRCRRPTRAPTCMSVGAG